MRKKILKSLLFINILIGFASLLTFFAPRLNPVEFGPLAFLGLLYSWIWIVNVLFVIFWVFLTPRRCLVSLAVLVFLFFTVGSPIQYNIKEIEESSDAIKVGSFNLHGLKKYGGQQVSNIELEELNMLLTDIDILCVQEAIADNITGIQKTLGFEYIHFSSDAQLCIFSKYPIMEKGTLREQGALVKCIWTDINTPNGPLRVYSAYLASNRISGDMIRLNEEGNIRETGTWIDIQRMFSKYRSASQERTHQVSEILGHLKQTTHPILLCGDFNDVPQSYIYNQVSSQLNDSFNKAGSGIGFTYNGKIPFLRIDYIFFNEKLNIHSYKKLNVDLSDHFPIIASFSMNFDKQGQ